MSPRLSPPPRYDADANLTTSSTSLKPYLQLPHILSLTWLAYPVISLVFVIFRLQISSEEAQSSVANAKDDFLTACLAAERAATAAVSMPRYLAIATNQQFANAVNDAMKGAREALILALTCMEAIINFLIGIYRSTFLCFLELVIVGGLNLLISAVKEITSFLQSTLNGIVSGLKNDATSLNSAIRNAVDSVNKINPFGNIQAPQFNISSLDALSSITISTNFETTLIQLNNSLPTVSSIKHTIQDLVDMPFEAVKSDINNTLLGLTLDPVLLPIPSQDTVSFCSNLDTSSIDNLRNDLVQITKIGTIILIVVLFLMLAGHCLLEWYKWRRLMLHLRFTREAWMSDPTTCHNLSFDAAPSMTLTDHNLLILQADARHPLLTRIAYALATRLRFTRSQHIHLRWFLHYIFHPPALACFLIGFFGLLSVQIQLVAIGPLEARYSALAAASVQDLSDTIATKMNNTMYNQSAAYANAVNVKVATVQSTINSGLFGWVNGTTTTLNSTLNNFYTDVQSLVGTVFNGTILETPAQDFIKCLIGSKVNAIEEALTFLNQNLNIDLPRVNESVLVISPTSINEITQPIATAAIGGTSGNQQGLVGRLVATYVDSLKKERLMFAIFMGLWGLVVLMGLAIVFWHSYTRNWVDAYKKRKWRKEQRDCLDGFVTSFRSDAVPAVLPHVRTMEKGRNTADPALRSFTPLPEASPLSINLFRRLNQGLPSPSHPLKSLEPTFEKSWDSFFREDTRSKDTQVASKAAGLSGIKVSRPMRLMNSGKRGDVEVSETSKGGHPENKPESVWFKPWTAWLSKKEIAPPTSEFVANRPAAGSPSPRPHLTISVEQASAATPRDIPRIDTTPSPVSEGPSAWSASPAPPAVPLVKKIPPKKAIPLTIPPPPPGLPQNTNLPTSVCLTAPDSGPLAMPLHNGFEQRPAPQKPTRLAIFPIVPTSRSGGASSSHKRTSTVPGPVTSPLAGPVSRHESTRSTSRLLTNMHVHPSGELVDPFATPFDDDAGGMTPTKPTRITNRFAGFAL